MLDLEFAFLTLRCQEGEGDDKALWICFSCCSGWGGSEEEAQEGGGALLKETQRGSAGEGRTP